MERLPLAWLRANPQEIMKQAELEPESADGAEALARIAVFEQQLKPALDARYGLHWVREPESDEAPGTVHCVLTLGDEISVKLDALMQAGRLWEATLLDMTADHWLMGAAQALYETIAARCREKGWGLTPRRMPGAGYPLTLAQRIVRDLCPGGGPVRYSDPGFLEPVKSLAYFYEVSAAGTVPEHDEECGLCNRESCPRRQVRTTVEIIQGSELTTVRPLQGSRLLKVLQEAGAAPDAPCGGRGTCGRCLVEIQTDAEPRRWVKACDYELGLPARVWIPAPESWQTAEVSEALSSPAGAVLCRLAVSDYLAGAPEARLAGGAALLSAAHGGPGGGEGQLLLEDGVVTGFSPIAAPLTGAAVDLGSTTIVLRMLDLDTGQILSTESFLNPLRVFGADVLSRLSDPAGVPELSRRLRQRLDQALSHPRHERRPPDILAVGGNNVMGQLLLGLPSEGLARAPYSHWLRAAVRQQAGDLWPQRGGVLHVMPGIGPFTGGDLTAGLIHCGVHETALKTLYLDLGTNGEMACGCRDGILVTAAAAGPAFESLEGASGVGAVPGAVRKVQCIGPGRWHLDTIGGLPPIGFCGSGLISLMAELVRTGLISREGTLAEEEEALFFEGGLAVTQQDIRGFQLAKGAIRAGVEVLLRQRGWEAAQLQQVIVAGGFARDIAVRDLLATGLIPPVDPAVVRLAGNTCLGGLSDYLLNKAARNGIYNATGSMRPVNLGETPDFEPLFIRHINF